MSIYTYIYIYIYIYIYQKKHLFLLNKAILKYFLLLKTN